MLLLLFQQNLNAGVVAAPSTNYDDHDYWRTYKITNARRRAEERRRNADIQTWLAGLDAPPVVAKPIRIRPQPVFVAHVAPPSEILAALPQQLALELPPVAPRRSLIVERAISSYRSSRRPAVADAVAAYRLSQTDSVVAYRRSKRPLIADAITAYRRSKAA